MRVVFALSFCFSVVSGGASAASFDQTPLLISRLGSSSLIERGLVASADRARTQ